MNHFFEDYNAMVEQLCCPKDKADAPYSNAKKFRGAIAAEILRRELQQYMQLHSLPVKVSNVNSYIIGSKYEYDLLLVKQDAQSVLDLAYRPEDVLAVIESKAGGLFNVEDDTNNIAKAVNAAMALNRQIRFGYITMYENVPVHQFNTSGQPTVNHWEQTNQYLMQKISGICAIYSVTLQQGKKKCDNGSDQEFEDFAAFLSADCLPH